MSKADVRICGLTPREAAVLFHPQDYGRDNDAARSLFRNGLITWDGQSEEFSRSPQGDARRQTIIDCRGSKRPVHVMIVAEDGTWHRPMTTLELAALQGFPTRRGGAWLRLTGRSHKQWRERIGNAVPPPAARAIAGSCAATLAVSAAAGFELSTAPIWVRERLQHAERVF